MTEGHPINEALEKDSFPGFGEVADIMFQNSPKGGIGLHGTISRNVVSIEKEGIEVNNDTFGKSYLYVTRELDEVDRNNFDALRDLRTNSVRKAIIATAGYAVERGVGKMSAEELESITDGTTTFPEGNRPSFILLHSDDNFRLNERGRGYQAPDLYVESRQYQEHIPAELISSTASLGKVDIATSIKTGLESAAQVIEGIEYPEAHFDVDPDADISNEDIVNWLDSNGIPRDSEVSKRLARIIENDEGRVNRAKLQRLVKKESCKEALKNTLSRKAATLIHEGFTS